MSTSVLKVSNSIFGKGRNKSGTLPILKKIPTSKSSSSEKNQKVPRRPRGRSSNKSGDDKSNKSGKKFR